MAASPSDVGAGTAVDPLTLLLLPGLDGTEIFFQPLLAALPGWIQPVVVTYPRAGCDTYADLLALIRRTTAGMSDYAVLGWSFSGPLALMLAAAEPERVRAVILSATFVRPPRAALASGRFALHAPVIWTWRVLRRLPLWLFRPPTDAWRRAKNLTWQRVPAATLARRLHTVSRVDVRAELRTCRAPILCLAASHDGVVPAKNVAAILRVRPSVQVATIPGPHLAMFFAPSPAARAIAEFLATTCRHRGA